jgi:pre-rRNA-processing protein IPI1
VFVRHFCSTSRNCCPRFLSCVTVFLPMFQTLKPVSQDDIQPHCPTLLLFTTSAQTHIFPEIRVDAIRFLNLFLNIIPETVVAGWTEQDSVQGHSHGSRVLEGYLGILNAGTSYGQDWGRPITRACLIHTETRTDTGPVKATSTASVTLSAAVCTTYKARAMNN